RLQTRVAALLQRRRRGRRLAGSVGGRTDGGEDLQIDDALADEVQVGRQHVAELLQDAAPRPRVEVGAVGEDPGDAGADLEQPAVDRKVVRQQTGAGPAG